MAIPFKTPTPEHPFTVATEKAAISRLFTSRSVPVSRPERLLLASWNIANLGVQKRKKNKKSMTLSRLLKASCKIWETILTTS